MSRNNRSLIGVALFTIAVLVTVSGKGSNFLHTPQNKNFLTYYELSGNTKTPRYKETIDFCKKLDSASTLISLVKIGTSPQGRDIMMLIADSDGETDPAKIRAKGKAVILAEACIHAGEPDGKDAGLMLLRDLAIYGKNKELLKNVTLLFIPIINVDGHEDFGVHYRINQNGPEEVGARFTAQKINMNRDFIKADAPETQALLKIYNRWLPELFIDIHVTNGADFQYVSTYGLDQCGYLPSNVFDWSKSVYEKELKSKMMKEGFPLFPYFDYKEWGDVSKGIYPSTFTPQYSNGYAASQNRIGLLVENHIYKPYKQRVEASYKILEHSLEIVSKNSKELISIIKDADNYIASKEFRKQPYILSYTEDFTDSTYVDYLTWQTKTVKSDLSGADWTYFDHESPVNGKVKMFTKFLPEYTTVLPDKYIIPSELASTIDLLNLHDIKLQKATKDTVLTVSAYRFSNYKWSETPYEGRNTLTTQFNEKSEQVLVRKGDYLLDMNQPKAKLAANILEPAASSSLLFWGFYNAYVKAPNEFWISLPYMEIKGREMLAKDPALKLEFEERLKDKQFASNPKEILNFFYLKVRKQAESVSDRYPIFRYFEKRGN